MKYTLHWVTPQRKMARHIQVLDFHSHQPHFKKNIESVSDFNARKYRTVELCQLSGLQLSERVS